MATRRLQTPIGLRFAAPLRRVFAGIEARLDSERERTGLWLPVALGAGIAAWFALPAAAHWTGLLFLLAGGVFYTLGTYFYHRESIPYSHAIWHLFVIAGSVCHFVAVSAQVLGPRLQHA